MARAGRYMMLFLGVGGGYVYPGVRHPASLVGRPAITCNSLKDARALADSTKEAWVRVRKGWVQGTVSSVVIRDTLGKRPDEIIYNADQVFADAIQAIQNFHETFGPPSEDNYRRIFHGEAGGPKGRFVCNNRDGGVQEFVFLTSAISFVQAGGHLSKFWNIRPDGSKVRVQQGSLVGSK